jgi:hypothetical protein
MGAATMASLQSGSRRGTCRLARDWLSDEAVEPLFICATVGPRAVLMRRACIPFSGTARRPGIAPDPQRRRSRERHAAEREGA